VAGRPVDSRGAFGLGSFIRGTHPGGDGFPPADIVSLHIGWSRDVLGVILLIEITALVRQLAPTLPALPPRRYLHVNAYGAVITPVPPTATPTPPGSHLPKP